MNLMKDDECCSMNKPKEDKNQQAKEENFTITEI